MSGTSGLSACKGARNPIRRMKITTAVAKPAVAGTMKAFSAFSKRTKKFWSSGRRECAASWETATRSFSAKSAGALLEPTFASNLFVCHVRHVAQDYGGAVWFVDVTQLFFDVRPDLFMHHIFERRVSGIYEGVFQS